MTGLTICDQPGCDQPATVITNADRRNTGPVSWYSCADHAPTAARAGLTEASRCGVHGRPTRYGRCSSCTPWVHDDGGRADAGFRGDTGDCVTRAIAIATSLPYRQVYDDLNAIAGEVPRRGATRRRAASVKTKPTSRTGHHRKVYDRYLYDLGWTWTPTMAVGSGCQVHLRADELPLGRLVVSVSKHLVAVLDGVVHDTYDPSRGGTRCVYGYWSEKL